jgi:hypothetical protein
MDYYYDWTIVADEKKNKDNKEYKDLINTLNENPPPQTHPYRIYKYPD